MTLASPDLRIVELDAYSFRPIAVYSGVTTAARVKEVSRTAIYNALRDGSVCVSSRWSTAPTHDVHAEIHEGETVEQFLRLNPDKYIA